MRLVSRLARISCPLLLFLALGVAKQASAQITYGVLAGNNISTSGSGTLDITDITPFVSTTSDGLKVSGMTLTYTPNAADNGNRIEILWNADRFISTGKSSPIQFKNHLDGTLTFSGFTINDITLRTITADTDFDLTTLHIGSVSSGIPFAGDLSSGILTQHTGVDTIQQHFSLTFTQVNALGTLVLDLPGSSISSLTTFRQSVAPEPGTLTLLMVTFCLFTWLTRYTGRRNQ